MLSSVDAIGSIFGRLWLAAKAIATLYAVVGGLVLCCGNETNFGLREQWIDLIAR